MKACSILDSALDLGKMMRRLYGDAGALKTEIRSSILIEFDDYIDEVSYYKRCISDLLSRSKETASLVSVS